MASVKKATTPNPLLKTYGERPVPFQFPGSQEKMYIGSEVCPSPFYPVSRIEFRSKVGNYLRLFRGTLYKKYPSLWRRMITLEERKWLIELGCSESSLPTNLTLLRASEVDEVLNGDDEKYRALTLNSDSSTARA